MRLLLAVLLWCILFAVCWPLAILFLVAWPILYLLSIPFRIIGALISACIAFFVFVVTLPLRLVGAR